MADDIWQDLPDDVWQDLPTDVWQDYETATLETAINRHQKGLLLHVY